MIVKFCKSIKQIWGVFIFLQPQFQVFLFRLMFSCLSRSQRPPLKAKPKKPEAPSEKDIKSLAHHSKQNGIVKPITEKKQQKHVKISQNVKIFKINTQKQHAEIIDRPTCFSRQRIDSSEASRIKKLIEGQENVTGHEEGLQFPSSILEIRSIVSRDEGHRSLTSFGIEFQQSYVELKQEIQIAVTDLTKAPFLPKRHQSSLEGMHKENSSSDLDDPEEGQLEQTDLNYEFSKLLLKKQYKEAQKMFQRMSAIQKNSFDPAGLSPLHLTTLMSISQQKEAFIMLKMMLKDKNVDPTRKNAFGSKPIEQAILFKSIPILTNIFRASYLHKISTIKSSLREIAQLLETLPDLNIQLYVKVGSFVPLIDKLTPDDTIRIFKKGKDLRVDYTLVGYSLFQSKRRSMSCVIHKLDDGDYTVLAINHDKKCFTDLLQPLEDEELVLFIQDLLSTEIKRTNPEVEKTQIKKEFNIFNQAIREFIASGVAVKHELKVSYNSKTEKLQPRSKDPKKDLQFLNSQEAYLEHKPTIFQKTKRKQLKLGVWLCEECPLKLNQLLEIMKFLSFSHESGSIIYNFLADEKVRSMFQVFPVKIEIPINFSFFLDIKMNSITFECPEIKFDFVNEYKKENRCQYQKTLIRKEKRLALIKLYT